MKNKVITGAIFGAVAGILDLIPMVMQNLPINADLSAFSMWVVVGVIISITDIKLSNSLKGILISLLILFPNLFIIGWEKPISLLPIVIITIFLGSLSGVTIGWRLKSLQEKN
jgi:hypothetical protein